MPIFKKQDLNQRQIHITESLPQISKPKSRASAATTFTKNADIEILDLVEIGDNPYSQKSAAAKFAGPMVQSKCTTTTNFKPLLKKPIYSYSSKELPDLSLVGFNKSLSHNSISPSFFKASQHGPVHTSSATPDTSTDYDEAGIDLFMADLISEVPAIKDTSGVSGHDLSIGVCGSSLVFSSKPLEWVPAHMDEKPSNSDDQPPPVNEISIDDWKPLKSQAHGIDFHGNSSVSEDEVGVKELRGSVDTLPSLSP